MNNVVLVVGCYFTPLPGSTLGKNMVFIKILNIWPITSILCNISIPIIPLSTEALATSKHQPCSTAHALSHSGTVAHAGYLLRRPISHHLTTELLAHPQDSAEGCPTLGRLSPLFLSPIGNNMNRSSPLRIHPCNSSM